MEDYDLSLEPPERPEPELCACCAHFAASPYANAGFGACLARPVPEEGLPFTWAGELDEACRMFEEA